MATEEKPTAVEKMFYLFLLGLSTYAWWRFTSSLKRKVSG